MPISKPFPFIRKIFAMTLFLSALTGFAQMPIFKRYYIADIPGLGWLAEFYVTYTLHYISAIAFIAIISYLIAHYILLGRHSLRVTIYGYARAIMLALILTTGILLVFRNLPGYRYTPEFVVALDFSHLGLVVLFLVVTLVGRLMGKRWVVDAAARSAPSI
jgi:hypothetical protein